MDGIGITGEEILYNVKWYLGIRGAALGIVNIGTNAFRGSWFIWIGSLFEGWLSTSTAG